MNNYVDIHRYEEGKNSLHIIIHQSFNPDHDYLAGYSDFSADASLR